MREVLDSPTIEAVAHEGLGQSPRQTAAGSRLAPGCAARPGRLAGNFGFMQDSEGSRRVLRPARRHGGVAGAVQGGGREAANDTRAR
eukprot:10342599-Lingulodinium_polyedra.AAC.1